MVVKKRVTLKDVATVAGVSKMTASRALRGASDVSKSNVDKVRQAAKDIGYIGNHLALSLSSQRSNLIGVIVPSVANIVFAEVLAGIAEAIENSGMQPVFGVTDYDATKEYDAVRNMLSWNPAGLIVTGLDQPEDTRRLLLNADIPIVQIMDTDGDPVDVCVGFSHVRAGEAMAEALLATGRKRFGYVGCGLVQDTRANKRLGGFKRALAKRKLGVIGIETSEEHSTLAAGRRLTAQVLKKIPELDCIYYSNDDLAAGGAFHCISEGIAVPEQLMLAGFNGLDLVKSLPVRIATSLTSRRDIGIEAVNVILRRQREGSDTKNRCFDHPPHIDLGL